MTIYHELREILVASYPLQMAIDQALRNFPRKLKIAIRDYTGAPTGFSGQGRLWFGCDTEYLDLYKPVFDQNGHRHFVRDPGDIGDGLYIEGGEIYKCCIGICFDADRECDIAISHIVFSICDFDRKSITFCIDNLDGNITVEDVNNSASYTAAAKTVVDNLIEHAKSPLPRRGLRAPIGFHCRQ
jgi:hypothetical protein